MPYNNLFGACDDELMKMYIHYSIVENIWFGITTFPLINLEQVSCLFSVLVFKFF